MADSPAPAPATPSRLSFLQSPGAKFVLIGIVAVLLVVPTLLVWGLVEDRAGRARVVSAEIAQGWGAAQTVNGPWIAIPRERTVRQGDRTFTERDHVFVSPESLNVDATLAVTERRRSIYSTPLYEASVTLDARFARPTAEQLSAFRGLDPERATLVVAVSDPSGFASSVEATLAGSALSMEPGMRDVNVSFQPRRPVPGARPSSGIHAPLDLTRLGADTAVRIDMTLRGSKEIVFVPAGQDTTIGAKGDWPHPGFQGTFLPASRTVSDGGFEASWSVPYLARGIAALDARNLLPSAPSVAVDLVKPLGFYQLVSRSLKYSVAFIALVFLATFVLEMLDARRLHFIQYMLVGVALVVFYVVLLALAERIGYDLAYLAGALATTALVAWYIGGALARPRASLWVGLILAAAYALIWLILNEDEYALLIGAAVAFLAVAATMFATRKVDWSAQGRP